MVAYNRIYFRNLALVKKAKYWFAKKLISQEQLSAILLHYKADFYTPALFIKIGLFIFTCIAVSSSFAMFSVFSSFAAEIFGKDYWTFTSFLFSVGCIIFLEYAIKARKTYRSGVDEALLYSSLGFLFTVVLTIFPRMFNNVDGFLGFFILSLPVLGAAIIRYVDKLMALLWLFCLYAVFFLLILKLGDIAKLVMPFALMLFSAGIYMAAGKYKSKEQLIYWKSCFVLFECVALLMFYAACNYFVIRESSIAFFDMHLAQGDDIPIAFLFYILTALVPLAYVFYGLKRKEKLLLWVGLVVVAAAALTFKHYFSLGHPEITLTGAGAVLVVIAYISIKYLKTPKYGITFKEEEDEGNFLKTNAEALMVAQSFSSQVQSDPSQNTTKFGGGHFGGGGAGNNY